jgi:putative pyruvate formate lyase activating enzyme
MDALLTISAPDFASGPQRQGRAAEARERAVAARAALAACRWCAHDCGVDRLAGQRGFCHAGAETRVLLAQWDTADELELIPTFSIVLTGCDLRCDFCITGAPSWNPRLGEALTPVELAARARATLAEGARTVTILGGEPTIHLPFLLEVVAELPDTARLVLKTNAYGSATSRGFLEGMFDVWCADYKFGNDACAQRLAGIPAYSRVVRENLLWADRTSDLIVRHLLMPGHVECCWEPVAHWLAMHLPGAKVSLRTGFWRGWRAHRHAELGQPLLPLELERARQIAAGWDLNLIE